MGGMWEVGRSKWRDPWDLGVGLPKSTCPQ